MENPRTALVVGAGIVGICTGIELRRRGWAVTLVDRLEPGHGCSFGNAGILASHAVVPIALPGLTSQLPRLLLDPEGPLVVRWASLPHTWRWLVRLRGAANMAQVRHSAAAMHRLYASSVERHLALAREAGVPELVRTGNGLYVHRDPHGIDLVNGLAWQLRRDHGAQIEVLEGAALRDAEPELAPAYTLGVRLGPMGHTVNPLRLTQAYAALLRALGGRIERDEVRALHAKAGGARVTTANGERDADRVVLATGAWTSALVRPLGVELPLIAERGYHLTYADPGLKLNHVVSEIGAHFAATSMEPGLRVAGTEEIGRADDPPAWRRADVLHAHARRLFPNADLSRPSRWMGPRPGTPDSLPVIGAVPGHPHIVIAAGHGHLGLTGAPHTGQLVARLLGGEAAQIDLAPYAPGRFAASVAARDKARQVTGG